MTDKRRTDQVDFGFKDVDYADKRHMVEGVFNRVSNYYDLMNDAMSFGLHRCWKHAACIRADIKPGNIVLDVACGTGDMTCRMMSACPQAIIWSSDYNIHMLSLARDRLVNQGKDAGRLVLADAHYLPFDKGMFDVVMMAFGLRNMTDKPAIIDMMHSVLKPGGRLVILEFSRPQKPLVRWAFDQFNLNIVPKLGAMIADDRRSYDYLAASIIRHPDADTLSELMRQGGFVQVECDHLLAGGVAIHWGHRA